MIQIHERFGMYMMSNPEDGRGRAERGRGRGRDGHAGERRKEDGVQMDCRIGALYLSRVVYHTS